MKSDPRADALREVLDSIDSGDLEATTGERAYVAGVVHGLTGEPESEPGADS